MQKKQKNTNTSENRLQPWKYKNLALASFIFTFIGFFLLAGLFVYWIFVTVLGWTDVLFASTPYILLAVAIIVGFIPAIMNICFMTRTKSDSWVFLLTTIILNILLLLLVVACFLFFTIFVPVENQSMHVIFMITSIVIYVLDLLVVFLQINSNLVSYLECKKSLKERKK